jgi:hypothetical protein
MELSYYKPGRFVCARGHPDGMTKDGQINEYVHRRRIPESRDGCHDARPACGNGAFNLWWSSVEDSVNCPACLASRRR